MPKLLSIETREELIAVGTKLNLACTMDKCGDA